jgi:hypothetical protein
MNKDGSLSLGVKLFSSAVLIQQFAAPAIAHDNHFDREGRVPRLGFHNLRLQNAQARLHLRADNRREPEVLNTYRAPEIAPINLDLTSSLASVVIQENMIRRGSAVTIQVGDATKTIRQGDSVSAAEFVSFQQAQTSRGQTLTVDQSGKAIGGTFSLSSLTSGRHANAVNDVVIPEAVQSIDRVSSRSQIDISGSLVNYGTLSQTVRGASGQVGISAQSIDNQATGSITTVDRSRASTVDLTLSTIADFDNSGTISSSGVLAITSGGNLSNNGGEISAAHGISLASTNISNSGRISSESANVILNSPSSQTLSVNNYGGVISAQNGDISLRSAGYNGTGNSTISGGDLLSRRLLLNAGNGSVDVNVEKLTGEVVSSGTAVHVNANTDQLIIGEQCLTGDPTYFNASGSITLTGDISVGEALAIVASGDIIATSGVSLIQAQDGAGKGYDITIVAGANVTGNLAEQTTTLPPGTPTTGSISFSAASASGGSIDFSSANSALAINSNSTSGNNAGGNVILAAYGINSSTGKVLLPDGSNIDASGNGTGTDGLVTIAAGSTAGTGINIGSISHSGTDGASTVFIASGNPEFIGSSSTVMTINSAGAITTGNFPVGSFVNQRDTDIVIHGDVLNSGRITVGTGATITALGALRSTAPSAGVGLVAGDTIALHDDVIAPGGIGMFSGHDIIAATSGIAIRTSSTGLQSGALTIFAGAAFTTNGDSVSITGASATGGKIDFETNPITELRSSPVTTGSTFGITLAAFAGSDDSGDIRVPTTVPILSGTNGSGLDGTVKIVAGKTSGTAISVGDIDSTGSAPSPSPSLGPGGVQLQTAQPYVAPAGIINISLQVAQIFSGDPFNTTSSLNAADISANDLRAVGAGIYVLAGNNVQLNNLTASSASGSGGTAYLTALGSTTFNIGSAGINSVNSILTGGATNGGTIYLISDHDIDINAMSDIQYAPGNGRGGTLYVDAGDADIYLPTNSLSAQGTSGFSGGALALKARDIFITGPAPLTLNADGPDGGAGGSVTLELRGGQTNVSLGSDYLLSATGSFGSNGGNINFKAAANQIVTISNGAVNAGPTDTVGTGGVISIEAGQLVADASQNVNLSVRQGDGAGSLSLHQLGTAPLTIGTANGQFSIGAGSQILLQSNVSIITGGNLSVATNALAISPFAADAGGTNITLIAGESGPGTLLITGDLNASGGSNSGASGNVVLGSNSTTAFEVGAKKGTNAILGTVVAAGSTTGNLTITNNGGGVTVSSDLTGFNSIAMNATNGGITLNNVLGGGATNQISLIITGTGDVTSKKTIAANSLNLSAQAGAIGGKKALNINAASVTASGGSGVSLSDGASSVTLGASGSTSGDFSFESTGAIQVNGAISAFNVTLTSTGANSIIDLTAAGSVVGNAAGTIEISTGKGAGSAIGNAATSLGLSAGTIVLFADGGTIGTLASPIKTSTSNLSLNALGDVSATNTSGGALNFVESTSQNVSLVSNNAITVNANLSSAQTISITGGSIAVNTSIGSTKSTNSIDLDALTGDITQISTKAKILTSESPTSSVDLTSSAGALGSSTIPLAVQTTNLTAQSGSGASDSIHLLSLAKKTALGLNVTGGGDVNVSASGGVNIAGASGKSVTIVTSGGAMNLNSFASITSSDGEITLNNLGKGKGSSINLGFLSSVSSFSTAVGGGTVQFVIGTLPPPLVPGTTPVGVTVTGSGGTVFFNNGITANGSSTINLINGNVIFSAGKAGPGAIVIEDATITADPPAPAPIPTFTSNARTRSAAPAHFSQPLAATSTSDNLSQVPAFEYGSLLGLSSGQDSQIQNAEMLLEITGGNALSSLYSLDGIGLINTSSDSSSPVLLSTKSGYSQFKRGWRSETELESGAIPGTLEVGFAAAPNLSLLRGSILAAPENDRSIETPFGSVKVGSGSVALVLAFSDGLAVYNLHDQSSGSVNVTAGGKRIKVLPGESTLIAKESTASLSEINPAEAIAHRYVSSLPLGNGLKAFSSQYSIPTAVSAILPLRELLQSNHPHARRTAKQLLKTTAVLMHLQAGGSQFCRHPKHQVTCMAEL